MAFPKFNSNLRILQVLYLLTLNCSLKIDFLLFFKLNLIYHRELAVNHFFFIKGTLSAPMNLSTMTSGFFCKKVCIWSLFTETVIFVSMICLLLAFDNEEGSHKLEMIQQREMLD